MLDKYYIQADGLQIVDEGNLSTGYYTYFVQAILYDDTTVDLANSLRVFIRCNGSSIGICWDSVPNAESYRVTRWDNDGNEGSLVVVVPSFFDNGYIQFE